MLRTIAVLGMVAALTGCITKPPRPDQVRTPPADRLLAYQNPTDGDATVIITRDAGYSGSACYIAFFVDGKVAAKLASAERATFHLSTGDHVLGAWNTGSGLCGYREGEDRREVAVSLKPGETRRFRILIGDGGLSLAPSTID